MYSCSWHSTLPPGRIGRAGLRLSRARMPLFSSVETGSTPSSCTVRALERGARERGPNLGVEDFRLGRPLVVGPVAHPMRLHIRFSPKNGPRRGGARCSARCPVRPLHRRSAGASGALPVAHDPEDPRRPEPLSGLPAPGRRGRRRPGARLVVGEHPFYNLRDEDPGVVLARFLLRFLLGRRLF